MISQTRQRPTGIGREVEQHSNLRRDYTPNRRIAIARGGGS
jgi:hypothetical protein